MKAGPGRTHATEDSNTVKTLCGRPQELVKVDNADPSCQTCVRLIKSLCFDHGVRRCEICPTGWTCGEGL